MTPMSEERLKQIEEIQKDAGFLFGDYARECFAEIHRLQSELAEQRKEKDELKETLRQVVQAHGTRGIELEAQRKEIEELRKQVESTADTEADGYIFCGKCGKNK